MAVFAGTHLLLQVLAGAQDSRNSGLLLFLRLDLFLFFIIPVIILLLLKLAEHLLHRCMFDFNLAAARLNSIHACASLGQRLDLHCLVRLFVNPHIARFVSAATYRCDVRTHLLLQDLVLVIGGTSVEWVVNVRIASEFVLATNCILDREISLEDLVISAQTTIDVAFIDTEATGQGRGYLIICVLRLQEIFLRSC